MARAPRTTSVVLGPHFAGFVRDQIGAGRFGSASEVIREALRLLEERETKLATLRKALAEGETSGFVEDFSLENLLAKARRAR